MSRFLTFLLLSFVNLVDAQVIHEHTLANAGRSGSSTLSANFYQNSKMNFYDIKHLKLDLVVQPKSKFISGLCNYHVVVTQALDTFAIEFRQTMQLDSVYLNNAKIVFTQSDDHIYIPLRSIAAAGTFLDLTFYYKGSVAAGFFAGTDASGADFTASLSESFQAREWFPAKQFLDDKIDSTDIWITTASNYKSGSNGLLKAVVDLPNNQKQYQWSCRYPISYYMPSVAVGNYIEYDNYAKPAAIAPDSILVQNLVYNNPNYFNQVKTQLDKTPRFIEKYSELYGLYPFYKEKYGHSQADIGGGMEHATMTTLKNFEEQLVAHELAHQWFGDNVTCASWSDIWLNESFATYSQFVMVENLPNLFPATAAETMAGFHNNAMSAPGGSVYIPAVDAYNESRIFNYRLTYAKGATAIHNLRFEMQNDALFFQILKKYQQQFANSFASTTDFKAVAEQVSGKNLTDFFNQKIYGEGYPIYNVTYLKHGTDTLVLRVNQTTSAPAVTPFFNGLVELRIMSADGDTTIKVNLSANNQSFLFYFPKTIRGVQVDPNNWILNGVGSIVEGVSTSPVPPDHITVFPNPVKNNISVRLPSNTYTTMRLLDVNGRLFASYTISSGTTHFSKSINVSPGVYFLHFYGSSKEAAKKIIVLEK